MPLEILFMWISILLMNRQAAMESIVITVDNHTVGVDMYSLWTEYEDRLTLESEVAHQLDKFEMIYQVRVLILCQTLPASYAKCEPTSCQYLGRRV
jgi:hypothetical protein